MASPYLLIGAFPGLMRFLPKPGGWMETLKQIMGFVLFVAVIWIFTFLDWPYVVPTIGLLFAVWAGCWWIGRTSMVAESAAKLRAWAGAAAFVGIMWILLFPGTKAVLPNGMPFRVQGLRGYMQERFDRRLAAAQSRWQPFKSRSDLAKILGSGKTVLIDFTADWCLTCKYLESTVLHTEQVLKTLDKNSVATFQADWTNNDPEVTEMLKLLGTKQVPIVAVFPAKDPNNPIVFKNGYTIAGLLNALDQAGPSLR